MKKRIVDFLSEMKNKIRRKSKLRKPSHKVPHDGGDKAKTLDVFKVNQEKLSAFFSGKDKFKSLSELIKKYDIDGALQTLFATKTREQINKIFLIAFFGAFTYTIGKTAALLLKPKPLVKRAQSTSLLPPQISSYGKLQNDIQKIKARNIFAAAQSVLPTDLGKTTVAKPTVDKNKICLKSEKKSSLPIKLLSTIVLQDSVKSIASVQVRSNRKKTILRENDKIQTLAEIGRINPEKIIIKNLSSGNCEYIQSKKKRTKKASPPKVLTTQKGKKLLAQKNPNIKQDGDNFSIKKKYRDEIIAPDKIGDLLSQALATKLTNPDGSLSFKMTEIVPGSLYSQLNIQNGDIITKINGKKITNLNEVMRLFGRVKDIDHFGLTLKRGGINKDMEYNFE